MDEVRFLDFQIVKLDTPVYDITYFFYWNASKADLDNHRHYLELYYDTLSETVKKLGSDLVNVYPFEVFLDHWKKYSSIGLLFALSGIKFLVNDSEMVNVAEIMKTGKTLGQAMRTEDSMNDECRRRIRDLVFHFVENEYI